MVVIFLALILILIGTMISVEPHVQYYNDRGENTEPRFDQSVEDYLDNGEEYAYLFENNEWVCYDLHKARPQRVDIPLAVVTHQGVK